MLSYHYIVISLPDTAIPVSCAWFCALNLSGGGQIPALRTWGEAEKAERRPEKRIKITSNTSMKIQFGAGSRVKSQSRMKTRLQNNAKREQPPSNPGMVAFSNLSCTLRSRQREVPPPNSRAATPCRQIEGEPPKQLILQNGPAQRMKCGTATWGK